MLKLVLKHLCITITKLIDLNYVLYVLWLLVVFWYCLSLGELMSICEFYLLILL